jgi:hypothetical protein
MRWSNWCANTWRGGTNDAQPGPGEKGYVSQTRRAKSLTLTEAGVLRAQELEARHAL